MFGLAKAKRGVAGTTSDGEPLAAEAWMTFLDGWVAITTLAALAANARLGWWWADAVAAAIIAAVAAFEAWSGWREAAMAR
jgi:divalent metal cation (Fe/Co/Zn/Cd) transporter